MDRPRRAMLRRDLALSREEIFQLFRVDHGKRSDYGEFYEALALITLIRPAVEAS